METKVRNSQTCASRFRALTFCLTRSRFSVIILLAGFGMLLTDQGRDLLTAYAEDGKTVRLALTVALWAWSIWGWSRVLLDIRYVDPPSNKEAYRWCRNWVPRLLGTSAFVFVAIGALAVNQVPLALITLGGAVLFLLVVTKRRAGSQKIGTLLANTKQAKVRAAGVWFQQSKPEAGTAPEYDTLWEALGFTERELRFPAFSAIVMFLAFLVFAALGNFATVWFGAKTGAMVMFFMWGATWLPIGSLMSYTADKYGIPLIGVLVALALAFSFINDNHKILTPKTPVDIHARSTVTQALDAWAEANIRKGDKPAPFIVVATAGGGIRAAYWTATVLDELHFQNEKFAQRTFAISGVSGGSVGATVYRALLDVPEEVLKKSECKGLKNCGQQILGHEFLGPVIAAALYPDLAQRFWPWPWFPDRGNALAASWEKAFEIETGSDHLQSSLASLSGKPWLPALFLNATWVENGRRIVASNLRFDTDDPQEKRAFVRSNDQLAVLRHDLSLSMAALNSARFPFVSPPGMWKDSDGKTEGRLQDGGLFENYGAETALEILNLACSRFHCGKKTDAKDRRIQIKPIVIFISSDPSLTQNLEKSEPGKPIEFAYEARTTPTTYERCRGGHGAEAASRLKEWTEQFADTKADEKEELFIPFSMCKTAGEENPPLGWALSKKAQDRIKSYLHESPDGNGKTPQCFGENRKSVSRLQELLNH